MHKENLPDNSNAAFTDAASEKETLAKIFDYPAIGELFSENSSFRLDEFRSKLSSTRDELERIVRYGSRDEADGAMRAVRGIEVTLEFLEKLQEMRLSENK